MLYVVFNEDLHFRIYMNMNQRRRDLEKALQVGISEKLAMGCLNNPPMIMQRLIAYKKAIDGTDMELAEALWRFLAHAEEFEIDGIFVFVIEIVFGIIRVNLDEEYEKEHGVKKNQLIVDRYFNPEGIEYLVHYVRKNTMTPFLTRATKIYSREFPVDSQFHPGYSGNKL